MEINIKWNICRVCLLRDEKNSNEGASTTCHSLVQLFNDDKKLVLNIFELSGVSMKPDDSLPDKICNKCVSIVNDAVKFRKNCRSSNIYLHSILEKTKSASTLFKPEKMRQQTTDDYEIESGTLTDPSLTILENDFEYLKDDKFIENPKNKEDDFKCIETICNSNYENEAQELSDNISDNALKLDELIEVSEEVEEELVAQNIEQDTDDLKAYSPYVMQEVTKDSNIIISGMSELEKLYTNASFSKLKNTEEYLHNSYDNDSVVIEKDNTDFKIGESMPETELAYVYIDEVEKVQGTDIDELSVPHSQQRVCFNVNQAQVCSKSLEITDEVKYYPHNPYISDLEKELGVNYLLDEDFGNSNISSNDIFSEESSELSLHSNEVSSAAYQKCSDISRNKIKRKNFKSVCKPIQVSVCEICGNQYSNRAILNIHRKIHLQFKKHECELCFKRFITACNLQAHMRIHTGERPFECKYCGRRFNDRTSNLRHERLHRNEKPFKCTDCGKCFSMATTLQNHWKVHTNERSYRCEPCGKSFKLPHHLKTHQNTSLHKSVVKVEVCKAC